MKSLLLLLLVALPWALTAQKYRLSVTEVEINGTSNLHDWTMTSEAAEGEVLLFMEKGKLIEIEQLHFKTRANTLKSGKKTMDNICYEALKAEDHPMITFSLLEVKSITNGTGNYTITATGWMTIAGTKRVETITATGTVSNGMIEFTGKHSMKMTDFDVEPPTALFGTLKTGDELEVVFRTKFSKPEV